MSDALRTLVAREIEQRSWSHRELARRTGLSQSLISKTLSGERSASADFCVKVAEVLEEPPEKLLRLAGILPSPPTSEDDLALIEIRDIVNHLSLQQRKEALRYLRFLYQSGQREE